MMSDQPLAVFRWLAVDSPRSRTGAVPRNEQATQGLDPQVPRGGCLGLMAGEKTLQTRFVLPRRQSPDGTSGSNAAGICLQMP